MRVRTRSGTIYRIEEFPGRFQVTRVEETEANPNGIPMGYSVDTPTLSVKIGEPIVVHRSDVHGGLRTSPVVAILT